MNKKLYIDQQIRIYQSHKLCPNEIIDNIGQEAKIKGFRKISKTQIMPLVELNNHKRIWLFFEEIHEY